MTSAELITRTWLHRLHAWLRRLNEPAHLMLQLEDHRELRRRMLQGRGGE